MLSLYIYICIYMYQLIYMIMYINVYIYICIHVYTCVFIRGPELHISGHHFKPCMTLSCHGINVSSACHMRTHSQCICIFRQLIARSQNHCKMIHSFKSTNTLIKTSQHIPLISAFFFHWQLHSTFIASLIILLL